MRRHAVRSERALVTLLLFTLAAVAYVCGGIAMKYSDGLHVLWPSVAVFVAFGTGAALQAIGMRSQTLGVGYVLVLGLEAVLAALAGWCFFSETYPPRQIVGMLLVLVGIMLLKWGG